MRDGDSQRWGLRGCILCGLCLEGLGGYWQCELLGQLYSWVERFGAQDRSYIHCILTNVIQSGQQTTQVQAHRERLRPPQNVCYSDHCISPHVLSGQCMATGASSTDISHPSSSETNGSCVKFPSIRQESCENSMVGCIQGRKYNLLLLRATRVILHCASKQQQLR